MNNNFLENSITKNIFIVISLAIIVIYLANKNKQENFVDINQAYKHHANKRCTSIYGNYHPKCAQTSRLNHVGYFKYNTIKYPLVDLNNGSYNIRYIMLRNKFVKLNKKYWNRGYYFPKPFFYNKNVPFSFVMNFLYRGIVINTHTKKMFYIFGKKLHNGTYKYVLFRKRNGKLQFSYVLPNRNKISDGDTIYIRHKISTFGPFVYYKK